MSHVLTVVAYHDLIMARLRVLSEWSVWFISSPLLALTPVALFRTSLNLLGYFSLAAPAWWLDAVTTPGFDLAALAVKPEHRPLARFCGAPEAPLAAALLVCWCIDFPARFAEPAARGFAVNSLKLTLF